MLTLECFVFILATLANNATHQDGIPSAELGENPYRSSERKFAKQVCVKI